MVTYFVWWVLVPLIICLVWSLRSFNPLEYYRWSYFVDLLCLQHIQSRNVISSSHPLYVVSLLYFRGYEKDISLAKDDIEGIEALYGERTVDNDIGETVSSGLSETMT